MEVSVSFTDGTEDLNERDDGITYREDVTVLGRAWIAEEGLELFPPVRVRYEKHPWMEKFEFDGIRTVPARRKGIGSKSAKEFVRSLGTIYSRAYDDYRMFGGDEDFDAPAYFIHAAEYFVQTAEQGNAVRMLAKFCGLTENMWREGNEEMLDICIRKVMPVLTGSGPAREVFEDSITEEFREYLAAGQGQSETEVI